MKLVLALCWTAILITIIVRAVSGAAPTWVAVFCPLSILVLNYWIDLMKGDKA